MGINQGSRIPSRDRSHGRGDGLTRIRVRVGVGEDQGSFGGMRSRLEWGRVPCLGLLVLLSYDISSCRFKDGG